MNKWDKYYWLIVPLNVIFISAMVLIFNGLTYYGLLTLLSWLNSFVMWKKVFGGRRKTIWSYVLDFLIFYFMIIYGVTFYDHFLEYKLNQFDLNGDSFFSIEEQTPEQIKYMDLWVNDLGRNLIYFTGALYSLANTLVLFLLAMAFRLIKRNSKGPGSK